MKIPNMDGEFGFKALMLDGAGWYLTSEYFLSEEEAINAAFHNNGIKHVKWPVEVLDNGSVYIPDRSELE